MKTTLRVLKDAQKYWVHLAIGLIAVGIATLAGFYTPWAMRQLTALATSGTAEFATDSLHIGLVLLVATALQAAGNAAAEYLNHYAALHYVAQLRSTLYDKLQHMSLRYFNKSRTGELTNRVMTDAMEAEILLAHVIPDILFNMLTFVGVSVLLFSINVKLALVSLIAIPFLIAITFWQSKRVSPVWKETSKARGELSGTVQDNFSGIKEIQIFNQQELEKQRVEGLALQHTRKYLKASLFFATSYPMLAFFTALGTVVVIIFGGHWASVGEVSIADIVGFVMYLSMFYGPVKSLSGIIERAGNAVAGCKRVYEVMDEISDVEESPDAKKMERVKGAVELRNISFAYNEGIPVLEHVNLNIQAGQTVALVGTTGVGKTTIASLLNRFYDPQEGSVLIDGIDIRSVTLSSLRDNISMVLQDTFLFNGTIYDNIAYGWKDATKKDIVAAAKAANADDFIMDMKDGYDTVVGERGVRLSGGQKQRISIARAILRNSPILILDEATSSLDTKTEKEIQIALDRISKECTTIVIAHRLSTIRNADQIIVLKGTGIAEMGTHDELTSRNGIYARLYMGEAS